jgi:hypothetical protein
VSEVLPLAGTEPGPEMESTTGGRLAIGLTPMLIEAVSARLLSVATTVTTAATALSGAYQVTVRPEVPDRPPTLHDQV